MRWVKANALHERSLSAITGPVSNMFDKVDSGSMSVRQLHPEAFQSNKFASPSQEDELSSIWPELIALDAGPTIGDPAYELDKTLTRVIFHKDGKTWTRLKTPELVRQLKAEKRKGM
jgi:hypothetical protein